MFSQASELCHFAGSHGLWPDLLQQCSSPVRHPLNYYCNITLFVCLCLPLPIFQPNQLRQRAAHLKPKTGIYKLQSLCLLNDIFFIATLCKCLLLQVCWVSNYKLTIKSVVSILQYFMLLWCYVSVCLTWSQFDLQGCAYQGHQGGCEVNSVVISDGHVHFDEALERRNAW